MFEEAVDSLPAELTVFKELFGPSFIRAIKNGISDCSARLKQLEDSYEPTLDDLKREYNDALKDHREHPDQEGQQVREKREFSRKCQ